MPAPMRVVELALSVDPRIADTGDKAGWGRYVNAGETPGASDAAIDPGAVIDVRSEEHTSELQSLMRISYAVFCLKKKKKIETGNLNNHISTVHTITSSRRD